MAEMIINIPAIEDNEIEEEKIFEEEIENRCIFLDDEITEETLSKITKQILKINKKDKKLEYKDRQPIFLSIDTIGGSLTASLGIYNVLKLSKTPIIGINLSCAFSGGFIIYLGCHERLTCELAQFLIHQGETTNLSGSPTQLKGFMDYYEGLEKTVKEIVLKETNISEELYNLKYQQEWYIFTKEAIKLGIAHKIVNSIDELF